MHTADEDDLLPPSIYDGQDDDQDDLWFAPSIEPDTTETAANPDTLFTPTEWAKAEASQGRALADAAAALARLDERLRHMPAGLPHRLAISEAAALSWADGHPLTGDTLALYLADRRAGGTAAQAMETAAWAVRRLTTGNIDNLSDFLGLQGADGPDLPGFTRARGADFAGREAELRTILSADLHPITRSALAFSFWRASDLSPEGQLMEAAVFASRIGADGLDMPFAPITTGAARALTAGGTVAERLNRWLMAVNDAATVAAMTLRRLNTWANKAGKATSDLSGRTPPYLIETLLRDTVVSAPALARTADVTSMTARRNLTLFQDRELIREVSGQTRYRYWRAIA